MKLLLCRECLDIFSLTLKERVCSCGKSSGRYIDDLNARIKGPCTPVGFANDSFGDALRRQAIENKVNKNDDVCCKGQEFKAFIIPDWAKSIKRD